jgi:hypothetical protein
MNRFDNKILIKLIQQYNRVFAEAYHDALNNNPHFDITNSENNEDALRNSVYNSIQNWHELPLTDDKPEMTCGMIINNIQSIEGALELAQYTAVLCDDGFPDLIKIKLASFGQKIIDEMMAFILNIDFEAELDQENIDLAISAEYLKLLGEWQCIECHERIIGKLCTASKPDERIADAVRFFLIALGEPVIPALIDQINAHLQLYADLDTACEYLLITLSDIGKDVHSDEMFSCFRDSFRKMTNKAIGAICLGDYGDGRGVVTLRGWLERHPQVTDNQIIGEILSSIKRLGGDISDLQHRLRIERPRK